MATGKSVTGHFFAASVIPEETGIYAWEKEHDVWQARVNTPANLIHLAANPYLLWMFLNVYLSLGQVPQNRGGLFDEFVFQLLKREGLTQGDTPDSAGRALLAGLEALAWTLQYQAVEAGGMGSGVELTLPRADTVQHLGGEDRLRRAASANLLEDAEPVRFTHQLLQEYFTARRLLAEIGDGLRPATLWPHGHWWQTSGWEEAVVLAAGMGAEAANRVFNWVLPANPEVAAGCILRSGMDYGDEARLRLRNAWLSALTDVGHQPAPARAAIGRALGGVTLVSGEPLDNRPGIGLREDGVPDIDWVRIEKGHVVLVNDAGEQTLGPFEIARYPVTHRQFQAFVDAPDGYRNERWWDDLEREEPTAARWAEASAPRETVSWYEAVAFCRWLSHRLGYEVRLPTEFEWQLAATGGDASRVYPWGREWAEGHCNSHESGLNRTTAVGLYPHAIWPGGPLDMAGNVWEWCLNKYDDPSNEQIDRSDGSRVLRGGSWHDDRVFAPAACRDYHRPGARGGGHGFRALCASPIR